MATATITLPNGISKTIEVPEDATQEDIRGYVDEVLIPKYANQVPEHQTTVGDAISSAVDVGQDMIRRGGNILSTPQTLYARYHNAVKDKGLSGLTDTSLSDVGKAALETLTGEKSTGDVLREGGMGEGLSTAIDLGAGLVTGGGLVKGATKASSLAKELIGGLSEAAKNRIATKGADIGYKIYKHGTVPSTLDEAYNIIRAKKGVYKDMPDDMVIHGLGKDELPSKNLFERGAKENKMDTYDTLAKETKDLAKYKDAELEKLNKPLEDQIISQGGLEGRLGNTAIRNIKGSFKKPVSIGEELTGARDIPVEIKKQILGDIPSAEEIQIPATRAYKNLISGEVNYSDITPPAPKDAKYWLGGDKYSGIGVEIPSTRDSLLDIIEKQGTSKMMKPDASFITEKSTASIPIDTSEAIKTRYTDLINKRRESMSAAANTGGVKGFKAEEAKAARDEIINSIDEISKGRKTLPELSDLKKQYQTQAQDIYKKSTQGFSKPAGDASSIATSEGYADLSNLIQDIMDKEITRTGGAGAVKNLNDVNKELAQRLLYQSALKPELETGLINPNTFAGLARHNKAPSMISGAGNIVLNNLDKLGLAVKNATSKEALLNRLITEQPLNPILWSKLLGDKPEQQY